MSREKGQPRERGSPYPWISWRRIKVRNIWRAQRSYRQENKDCHRIHTSQKEYKWPIEIWKTCNLSNHQENQTSIKFYLTMIADWLICKENQYKKCGWQSGEKGPSTLLGARCSGAHHPGRKRAWRVLRKTKVELPCQDLYLGCIPKGIKSARWGDTCNPHVPPCGISHGWVKSMGDLHHGVVLCHKEERNQNDRWNWRLPCQARREKESLCNS
jgi:hypothetical protein